VLNSTKKIKERNVLCPWITVEGKEDVNYFEQFEKDLKEQADHFKTNKVVLLPFVHFVYHIPPYEFSFGILMKLKDYLESKKYDVKLAHFGSAKDFKFFSPADEKQVTQRSYPNPVDEDKRKDEEKKKIEKESIWFSNKAKTIRKSKGKIKTPKTKEVPKRKHKKSQSKPKQRKSGKALTQIRVEKKPEKKEWKSSLYNLAPSVRNKK
jgi:hypothetical protein